MNPPNHPGFFSPPGLLHHPEACALHSPGQLGIPSHPWHPFTQLAPSPIITSTLAEDEGFSAEMRKPSVEKDELVACALVFNRGKKSIEDALKRLKGAQGMSGMQWMRYYMTRSHEIDPLVQSARRDSSQPPGPDVSRIDEGSAGGSPSEREPIAKSSSPELVSERSPRRSVRSKVQFQKPLKRGRNKEDEDNDEYRPVQKPRSGRSKAVKRKQSVTPEHRQLMAKWQLRHGAQWDTMSDRARWELFAKKHGIRNLASWATVYQRWNDDIMSRLDALLAEGTEDRDSSEAQDK